jgi:hypothetical protein
MDYPMSSVGQSGLSVMQDRAECESKRVVSEFVGI